MKSIRKNVLLVGGGSGGHIVPISEIYKILKKENSLKVYVVGGGGEIENVFYGDIPQYHKIYAGKLHRVITWKNIIESIKLIVGFFQSFFLLIKIKPKVIFAKGGYVSLPVTFWARILSIPYFIHESDIEMGYSNRLAANGAKKIFTGFPVKFFSRYEWVSKVEFVGQLVNASEKTEKFNFGFKNNKSSLFVTGGSQGSKIINDTVFDALKILLPKYNIMHQTGSLSYNQAVSVGDGLDSGMKSSYFVKDFFDIVDKQNLMYSAIKQADLIITRCGLNTLAEIAFLGKPMIMIPYQHSSGDHQMKNAMEIGAVTELPVINDKDLNKDILIKTIETVLDEKNKDNKLMQKYEKIFPRNGLKIVTDNILKEVI